MRRLIIGFYLATTPQDWQFGPGFYIGSHLELTLYLGPWSFNLEFELEKEAVKFMIHGYVHFDDFRGQALWDPNSGKEFAQHPSCKGLDPFTKKPYVKVYRSPSKGAQWKP